MSLDQAKTFFEKVKQDEELAKSLSNAKDNEAKLEIAKKLGYNFDIKEAKLLSQELSKEDLENLTLTALCWPDGCVKWHK